ncbi:MAG TPA: response regulator [Gammaproteobacteria bacterium]|nr:response regulator [Gammaproteobacteria bacterium]
MNEQSVEKPEILVVDDSKVIRLAAKKMLGDDYEIHLAEDGQVAWEMLQKENDISVVFTDLSMPNLNGMELLEHIRNAESEHIAALPVIILTGHDDTESVKQTVFDAGATDFISKPFESIDLISRAKAYARLSRKVVELEKKTGYDQLTGLYNATSLEEQGAKAFSFASRHKLSISTVYFEITEFQECFLNHGKNVAQHIITAVGKHLQEVMREEDIAARVGVAKYVLVLPMTNRQKTETVVSRMRESINKLVFDTGKERIRVNFVAGYTVPDLLEEIQFSDMLEQADTALQRAISSADEPVVYFDGEPEVEPEVFLPVVTEQDIEQAFANIIDGNYYRIPEQHLVTVVERLAPFMEYVDNQHEEAIADDAEEKNIAV